MTHIIANPDGTFTLPAGSYIIGGASDKTGSDHPDLAFYIWMPDDPTRPQLITDVHETGYDLLYLPYGPDRFGVRHRTVGVRDSSFVAGLHLYISQTDSGHLDGGCFMSTHVQVTFDQDVTVALDGTTIRIGDIVLDSTRPGYYTFHDGTDYVLVDMDEDGLAEILGYDADGMFDEHGFWLTVEEEGVAALRALGTPVAIALADEGARSGVNCLYYSGDLQPTGQRLAA